MIESSHSILTKVFNNFGICVTGQDFRLLYQNDHCIKRCGVLLGQHCKMGCAKNYLINPDLENQNTRGLSRIGAIQNGDDVAEYVTINDGDYITTIQYPFRMKYSETLQQIAKHSLTKTELNIAITKLQGWTNREIAEKLFISQSTLRTHLNNIYKKIPEALKKILTKTT